MKLLMIMILSSLLLSTAAQSIPGTPTDISPLLIGEKIPDIQLSNLEGKKVSLNDIISKEQTLLIFYRGGWCPYCNLHLAELQSIESEILKSGFNIIAISPDSPDNLKASIEKHKLNYTLLSDSKTEAARAFGIAFQASERYGEMLGKASGSLNTQGLLPVPAVFVLNKRGEILFEYINPDYKKRLKGSLLLAVLAELKE